MRVTIFIMALLLPLLSFGQPKPLHIGDTIPDIEFTNVINYPVSKIRLSDFRDKLVILDFWATWCGSCIRKFPKLDSLQEKFSGKLQIIMVNSIVGTGDDEAKIKSFLEKWDEKHDKPFRLLTAIRDTLASELFPHTFLPHYVWLGSNGKVLGITSSSAISEENILIALQGCQLEVPVKLAGCKSSAECGLKVS